MKRYRDLNSYLKERFGQRVQKIPLDAGLNCPNRDGTISTKGCIYCDRRGSGTGAMKERGLSLKEQLEQGIMWAKKRYGAERFISYFQSYTNTYAPVHQLKELYDASLTHPGVVGLSVSTRPDCVNEDVIDLLAHYSKGYMVWLELGLQSAHNQTLTLINRGHDVGCFEQALELAQKKDIDVCAHIILGLPSEDRTHMIQTARYLSSLPVWGVKIHLLYVTKGTELARMYSRGDFRCLRMDEYAELVVEFLEHLRSDIIIHRITGDPPVKELIAPMWAMRKSEIISLIRQRLEEKDTYQGKALDTN